MVTTKKGVKKSSVKAKSRSSKATKKKVSSKSVKADIIDNNEKIIEFKNKKEPTCMEIIKKPLYAFVIYSVVTYFWALFSFKSFLNSGATALGWVVLILIYGYTGYNAVNDFDLPIGKVAKYGAKLGIYIGLIAAVVGILSVYTNSALVNYSVNMGIEQATASGNPQGINVEMMETYVKMGSFIQILFAPILNAIIGAIIASLAGLVGKKI